MQAPSPSPLADAVAPPLGKAPGPFWRCVGALIAGRTSHGDTTVTLERVSFWLVLLSACFRWWQGEDIPASMASFLNLLVGAVFGQSALSTVGMVARKTAEAKVTVAEALAEAPPMPSASNWTTS